VRAQLAVGGYDDPEDLFTAVAAHCEQCINTYMAANDGDSEQMGRRARQLPSLINQLVAGRGLSA
jgi:hypothetical protein